MKILVVEDEVRLARLLQQSLSEQSYTVGVAGTCAEANDAIVETHYDVAIVDLNLPDGDGFNLIAEWRASGLNEPVIILSARDGTEDRVNGLNLGADDYLAKPFSTDELLARIRALMRRRAVVKTTVLERGPIKLDLLGRILHVNDVQVELTGREYALLELFMHNGGRILTRSMIAERVWSGYSEADTNVLDVYMSRLRLKLETEAGKPLFKTVRGIGYRLL